MFKIILLFLGCFLSNVVVAGSRSAAAVWLFPDTIWQRAQAMHVQTQLQLQSQDQYRRMLLMQNHEWQIQRMQDQQDRLEDLQHSLMMHNHSHELKSLSKTVKALSIQRKQNVPTNYKVK